MSEMLNSQLQDMRYGREEVAAPRKRCRMEVEPGKSVQGAADNSNVDVSLSHSASPGPSRVNSFDATSDEDLDDSGSNPEWEPET